MILKVLVIVLVIVLAILISLKIIHTGVFQKTLKVLQRIKESLKRMKTQVLNQMNASKRFKQDSSDLSGDTELYDFGGKNT